MRNLCLFMMFLLPSMVIAFETTWIDVRTAQEFSQNHVKGAINIPHENITAGVSELGLKKSQIIYLYCRSGNRSGKAKKVLEAAGYQRVINLGGLSEAQKHYDEISARSNLSLKQLDSELFR